MSLSIPGLGSGLDTQSLVSQLMALEKRPQQLLQSRRSSTERALTSWSKISTSLQGLTQAASALVADKDWVTVAGTSSNTTLATVAATSNTSAVTPGGELRFKVDHLATSGAIVSSSTVASLSTTVATGTLVVGSGLGRLGLADLSSSDLALGVHTVAVTQASQAASVTGSALTVPVTIDATNDTVSATVNGVAGSFTLAHGTYSSATTLAQALGTALGATTSVQAAGSALEVSTVRHGSQATLELTGGTALAALGLSVSPSAATGTDGRVSVGGVSNTLASITAGATVSLSGPDGSTVSAVLAGPLAAGTSKAFALSSGDGSLSAVANAINSSAAGLSAATVQVAPGAYRLQVSSRSTGVGSDPMVSQGALSGLTMVSLATGTDARLTMGEGPNAYEVSSSSNTFSSLLPGVAVTAVKVSTDQVTVTSRRDTNALATKVDQLVGVFNATVADIRKEYQTTDVRNPAPLAGDGSARRLVDRLYSLFAASNTSTTTMSQVGLTLSREGRLNFDRSKFTQALEADPEAVASVFKRVTTFDDNRLSVSVQPASVPVGSYTVNVTSAATRAAVTGTALSTLTAAEDITVTVGTSSVTYSAASGETLSQVVAGLNAALENDGIGVTADSDTGALRLRTAGYGSAFTFTVSSSAAGVGQTGIVATAGGTATVAGTDVVGSFTRGTTSVTATGRGQLLTADPTDAQLKGLVVRVTADGAESPVFTPATMTYRAGLAQALHSFATVSTSTGGVAATSQEGRRTTMRTIDAQISAWDNRLAQRERSLRALFTRLDSAISAANNTQSWLQGQLSGLNANNGRD